MTKTNCTSIYMKELGKYSQINQLRKKRNSKETKTNERTNLKQDNNFLKKITV